MKAEEAKGYLYIGAAVAIAYVAYRMVNGAAGAAKSTAQFISDAGGVANDVTAGVVGGIGSAFGLPTPGETIDDPYIVRYLIDTQGHMHASQWGTALAYMRALAMPAGSGRANGAPSSSPVSNDVIKRVAQAPLDIQLDLPGDSLLSGPSFNSTKDQKWSYF